MPQTKKKGKRIYTIIRDRLDGLPLTKEFHITNIQQSKVNEKLQSAYGYAEEIFTRVRHKKLTSVYKNPRRSIHRCFKLNKVYCRRKQRNKNIRKVNYQLQ